MSLLLLWHMALALTGGICLGLIHRQIIRREWGWALTSASAGVISLTGALGVWP